MTRMSSPFWKDTGCTHSLLRLNGPVALPTERKKRARKGPTGTKWPPSADRVIIYGTTPTNQNQQLMRKKHREAHATKRSYWLPRN